MTTQYPLNPPTFWTRFTAIGLFLIFGALIMVVFSPWRPLFEPTTDLFGRLGLITLLAFLVGVTRKKPACRLIWPLLLGLLIMAVAVSLMWIVANYLIDNFGLTGQTPQGMAWLKLSDFVIVAVVVISFSRALGFSYEDLYLQKGKLPLGLWLGVGTFLLAAALAIPGGMLLFNLNPDGLTGWKSWLPWLLVFVFANGAMEEILFRGLFLKKFEPLLGNFPANLTIAVVFSVLHIGVDYTNDQLLFAGVVFLLALGFGAVTQKTRALWPAILFHAGMDIAVMLGIFTNF
jgi:membrane protease YdiL (CAAX protease family)